VIGIRKIPSLILKYRGKNMDVSNAKKWMLARIEERTSHDGIALIAVCGSVILFGGLAKLLAWVGLLWGVYTLVKGES
jgi:hypothetical protein